MAKKTVHCSICGKAITGKDFGERMRKLRKHRKEEHPTAHKRSTKKTLKTKRRKGIIADPKKRKKRGRPRKTHDPAQVIKVRRGMVEKPKVLGFGDYEGDGLIRVLEREDGSLFPEFAIFMKDVDDSVVGSLEFSKLKEEKKNKFVLRTDRFNIFVYL